MGKGSKKRKAAKRKKEMGTSNNNPGIPSHVSGKEMMTKREDTSGVGSNVIDSEIFVYSVLTNTNKTATHQNGGTQINKAFRPKDDLTANNGSIKLIDPTEEVVGGSGSKSSDEEYRVIREDAEAKEEKYHMPEATQIADEHNKSSEGKVSPIFIDIFPKREEYKVSSDAVEIIAHDSEGTLVSVDSGLNAEHKELSTVSKCSESQPLIPSASQPVKKKSSWKACCGIFELFTSSDR